ncbi:MAG: hypothetical protein ACYCXK_00970 [Candidatus Humimicrobiaceae bacterium]
MKILDRFFKYAKDMVVDPGKDIENRIIDKIENLSDSDQEILDEGFLDFLKKSNSRLYYFSKKLKENSGYLIAFGIIGFALVAFLVIEYRNYSRQKTRG